MKLPAARVSDDSVMLDIGFVHIPVNDNFAHRMWSELDEQVLPPELRRRLADNGLRIGLVRGQLPQILRRRLDQRYCSQSSWSESKDMPVEPDLDLGEHNRRMQLRPGKRGEIVTADSRPQLIILCQQAGHVCGETFTDAQTTFALEGFGNDDGSATIELTPEIQFGASQMRFVGRDGAFQREARRERRAFDDLEVDARLTPGQTLVVTSVGPPKTLGGNFFRAIDGDTNVQKLLLVRLARSPGDKLFEPHDATEPIDEVATVTSY